MPNDTYQVRPSIAAGTQEYSLTGSALVWPGGSAPLAEIKSVRIYSVPGMEVWGAGKVSSGSLRCAIALNSGTIIKTTSANYLSVGNFEDRSPGLIQFAAALAAQVRAANPGALFLTGMPPALWWLWFLTFGLLEIVLVLCIALGLLGLTLAHQNTFGTFGIFLFLAFLLIGPITFMRATWRRRTRPLDPANLSGIR